MSQLNAEWHKKNKMHNHPKLEERVRWHVEHSKYCRCRQIPDRLLAEIKRRGIKLGPYKG
jgi:hypothetical protein